MNLPLNGSQGFLTLYVSAGRGMFSIFRTQKLACIILNCPSKSEPNMITHRISCGELSAIRMESSIKRALLACSRSNFNYASCAITGHGSSHSRGFAASCIFWTKEKLWRLPWAVTVRLHAVRVDRLCHYLILVQCSDGTKNIANMCCAQNVSNRVCHAGQRPRRQIVRCAPRCGKCLYMLLNQSTHHKKTRISGRRESLRRWRP